MARAGVEREHRRQCLAAELREKIPGASFVAPDGGYFLWVKLPDGISDPAAVLRAASAQGLALVSGDDFVPDGGSGAVRIAFSGVTADEIREGVTRLATAIETLA